MNFKKLPKEKRNQLVLVGLITASILIGLGFGVVRTQYGTLAALREKKDQSNKKLQQVQEAVKHMDRIEAELEVSRQQLTLAEKDVATGDLYSWAINTLRTFKANYKIDMPQFSPIGQITDVTLIPSFPYKQTVLSVGGTAHYHDLGRFIADLENTFPHIRVENLTLDTVIGPGSEDKEKLSFRMDIAALVKPNAS